MTTVKYEVFSSAAPDSQGVEQHTLLASRVNDFITKNPTGTVTWLQSSGLRNGSWLVTTLTAVIKYNAVEAVVDPFAGGQVAPAKK